MPLIRPLSQSLINKIAAGEVIERPASVVKELMENAVDAGAGRIDVTIRAGGGELVRVVDDGCGIPAEQLPLAVASHATSKLAEADDLFRVTTLGFRGEALASIAEISRLVLRSRTPDSPSGAELEVVGGKPGEVAPCGSPPGTSIEVQNLFFNTPVRRKFLRTTQTEFGHISEAFARIALACPEKHFTLRHNDRSVFELPACDDWRDRIGRLFGRELAEQLIWVESGDGDVRLRGYVANPAQSRGNNRMQYLLLNGRHIRDRSLQHALSEAYRGLLMTGRYPIAFLRFEMPPEMVDVNVHPTKLEVRFQDGGRLYGQLLAAIRQRFLTTDLTAQVRTADDTPESSHDPAQTAAMRQELVDWAKGQVAGWGRNGAAASSPPSFDEASPCPQPHDPLQLNRIDRPGEAPGQSSGNGGQPSGHRDGGAIPQVPNGLPGRSSSALQVHNRYLVAETDDGVTIIDQHALHERILYEALRRRVLDGAIESQSLLVPEPVDLGPSEAATVLENCELLARLGVVVEPFGGDTVLISGYPAMLANFRPADVLQELLSRLIEGGKQPDGRDILDALLHTIACKAAVKAGDRLAPEEISALLEQRHLVDDAHHCPHGRPTALVFTREELDRQFRRV